MVQKKRREIHKAPNNRLHITFIVVTIIALILAVLLFPDRQSDPDLESNNNEVASISSQTNDTNETDESEIVASSDNSSVEETTDSLQTSESEEEEEVEEDNTDSEIARIYDLELMDAMNMSFLEDPESLATIDDVVQYVIDETGTDPSTISVAYYNFLDDSTYNLNENYSQIIASMYKVGLVAMYIDLINEGVYSYDTMITVDGRALSASGEDGQTGEFTLDSLMQQTIMYSNNVSAWALIYHHFGGWNGYVQALSNFTDISSVGDMAYSDNYLTSAILMDIFSTVATDPSYSYLIDLMSQATPNQLFTAYVQDGMANKFGRFENVVTDGGIYYENDEPVYILIGLTEDSATSDSFLETLNLRVNEWTRYHYISR
ncbi:serine hydrolase [Aerococcaceae bacterium DSM 111176]|nr:serine hydrolase [Aerococcaceae bacterium DSM 111176]